MKAHARPRPAARGGFDRWNLDLAPPSATTRTGLFSQGQALSARPDRPKRTRPTHCAWILHAKICRRRYVPAMMDCAPSQGIARQILVSSPKARRRPFARHGRAETHRLVPSRPQRGTNNARHCKIAAARDYFVLFSLAVPLHTATYRPIRTYTTPRPGSFEVLVLIASNPSLAPCLALSLLPPR